MRTIIIGDVHGCDAALRALLEKVQAADGDRLVMLGDLFDRGPESWEVFQTVQALAAAFGPNFVLLRGNHEDYLLQEKLTLMQKMVWERVGRGDTVRSFKAHRARLEDAAPWLKAQCQLFWRGDGFQCVHAGLMIDPIEMNDVATMIHDHTIAMRNVYKGPLTIVGHIALPEPTHFVGDEKTVEKLPFGVSLDLPAAGTLCIDTGCGKGGRLTAMVIENGKYILESVPENPVGIM